MFTYPNIDPIAFSLGPLHVHWYGLMYLLGFSSCWLLGRYRARQPRSGWTNQQVDDLLFFTALGVVLGGRLGYVFFYHPDYLLQNPLWAFYVWEGGMSFHGGLLGVIASLFYYSHRVNKAFGTVMDFMAPMVPVGLAAGRVGNFINGELWGTVTQVPWGMVFPNVDSLPRHPSQWYEFGLEGILLFTVLWLYSMKPRPRYAVSGLFLLIYGCSRFFIEFFREPDAHLGYLAFGWLTMGHVLTLPMVGLGLLLVLWVYYRYSRDTHNADTP